MPLPTPTSVRSPDKTTPQPQIFTFEGHYRDSDGGNRCDIVIAPDRHTALCLAGVQMAEDNEWVDERLYAFKDAAEFYESEVHIDAEWGDLDGTACPNCSAHGGRDTMVDYAGSGATIRECATCGYQWLPLGKKLDPTAPTAEQITAEVEAWRLENMVEPEEED